MPRLYIKEYCRALRGKTVCLVCRESILRDHFDAVIADIKFLNRQAIVTKLYHNISNRFANRKYFRLLRRHLPETHSIRLFPGVDIYNHVLDQEERVHKLIFLERHALVDSGGRKINALTTKRLEQCLADPAQGIANINIQSVLERIRIQIDNGSYDRVHIVPAGKKALKYELFTIEGHGTLITNNYGESFKPVATQEDIHLINGILNIYKREGFLIPRSPAYIQAQRGNFYVTLFDDIVVGCVEKKPIDEQTVEIAALAISTRFRNQRVGVFMVQAFMQEMQRQGYNRFISLTNNPRLEQLYKRLGFETIVRPEYRARQLESPGVTTYFLEIRKVSRGNQCEAKV